MERGGSHGRFVNNANRRELDTLTRLLALEREKRIGAERQVEAERQALLQLRSLLQVRPIPRKNSSAERKDSPAVSPSSVSSSVSQASSPQLEAKVPPSGDDLLATVFKQLPVEAQGLLGRPGGKRGRGAYTILYY